MGGATTKKCHLCQKNVSKGVLKLQCGVCKQHFHLECGHVSEVDARLMAAEKRPWTCGSCKESVVSPISHFSGRRSTLFSQPSQDRSDVIAELKLLIKNLQDENREIIKSLDFLSEQFDEEKKRSKVLEGIVGEITKENKVLKVEVDKLKSVSNKVETKKIENNLSITGLIAKEDTQEQALKKTLTLFSFLDTPLSPNDISNFKQVPTKSGTKAIVTVKSEHKKQILQSRSSKGKLTLKNTKFSDSDGRIFVDEELTKETYALFKNAKEQLRRVGYKYVWHRDGKILSRKNDDSKVIAVRNESHLKDLLK